MPPLLFSLLSLVLAPRLDAGKQPVHHGPPSDRIPEGIRPFEDEGDDANDEHHPRPDAPVVPPANPDRGTPQFVVGVVPGQGRGLVARVRLLWHLGCQTIDHVWIFDPIARVVVSVTVIVAIVSMGHRILLLRGARWPIFCFVLRFLKTLRNNSIYHKTPILSRETPLFHPLYALDKISPHCYTLFTFVLFFIGQPSTFGETTPKLFNIL